MALKKVNLGAEYFPSPIIGRPLANADIYVGEPGLDPRTPANQKQISVLQEDGTVLPISQPISTGAGGVPVYSGEYVTILVEHPYSLRVDNSAGSQVYYVPTSGQDDTTAYLSEYDGSLPDAVGDIATDEKTLIIDIDADSVVANLVFPATLAVEAIAGVNIPIATGVTATFNGGFTAPPDQQVITLAGTAALVFVTQVVYPIWWGDADTQIGFYVSGTEYVFIDANGVTGDLVGDVTGGIVVDAAAASAELMPNQVDRDFSGASAWANVDINAYDETDDLTITANAADQYCTLPIVSAPTTATYRYSLKFDVANIVETWNITDFTGAQVLGTVSANGLQQEITFTATTTGGFRIVSVGTAASGDFDNFTLTTDGFVALWDSETGTLEPKSDVGITYNVDEGRLTATELKGLHHGHGVIEGDTTQGRVFRFLELFIEDGSGADLIKMTGTARFNGDDIAVEDDVNGTGTRFYHSGTSFGILDSAITGNSVEIITVDIINNSTGEGLAIKATIETTPARINFIASGIDGTDDDISDLINTDDLTLFVGYVTDA